MIGGLGFLISSVQAAYFEGDILRTIRWYAASQHRYFYSSRSTYRRSIACGRTWPSALCLLGYIAVLFVMYTGTSIFLKSGDAAAFNLALLTSDFFAVVAAKYLFDEQLSQLYFLGFTLIVVGIIIYHRSPVPTTDLDDALEAKEQTNMPLLVA